MPRLKANMHTGSEGFAVLRVGLLVVADEDGAHVEAHRIRLLVLKAKSECVGYLAELVAELDLPRAASTRPKFVQPKTVFLDRP